MSEEAIPMLDVAAQNGPLIDRLTASSHVINMKECKSLRDPLDE